MFPQANGDQALLSSKKDTRKMAKTKKGKRNRIPFHPKHEMKETPLVLTQRDCD